MAGELHELSLLIGGLKADIKNLAKEVREHKTETTSEHRKVHEIVDAMSEAVRNLTRIVAEMKPLTDDYRLKQASLKEAIEETANYKTKKAEDRGAKRLWLALIATFGGVAGMVLNKLADWLPSLFSRPHP